jgi:hypothetical protein
MRRLLQSTLIAGLLCGVVSGCAPSYGYYGSPGYGYAPYSYGWYGRGYAPDFADHHSWEEHHMHEGHHDTFWHGSPAGAHYEGGGHPGGFSGGGHAGGFGGGHGGGGHR